MKAHAREPERLPENLRIATWLKTVWPYLLEYRWRVVLALTCLLLAKLVSVGMPFLLKYQVDYLATAEAAEQPSWLWLPLGLLLAYGSARFLSVFVGEVRDVLFGRVTERAMRRMALKVFQHLHQLSLAFHLDRQTGALQRDIERGTNGISFLMRFFIFNIGPTLIELVLVIGLLLINYPPVFAVITLVAVITYVGFSVKVTEWRTEYVRQANKMDSTTHARALDSLLNYENVKYFTAEQREADAYDDALMQWEQARRKNRLTLFSLNSGQALIISVAMTLMLVFAAYYVMTGTMTVGDFTLVNAFMFQLFLPLNFLGFVYREIKASMANIERLFELLDEQPAVRDDASVELKVGAGEVVFNDVDFGYPNGRPVLQGFNLTVAAGQTVALVGASGAGKSTVTRLLWRFYEPQSGSICIDGQSLTEVSQASLRQALGIVPQDTVLFNDSIKNNLLYARPDASDVELDRVASMAKLDGLLAHAEQGWNTLVGERGLKLSGGEKQRLAIARMLLKQPAIMIFDEATSSLDSRTENSIMQAIKSVAEGRTAIIIAHRLSTITDADSIVVMEQGAVVEQGHHAELLQRRGAYWQLWHAQQKEEGQHATFDD